MAPFGYEVSGRLVEVVDFFAMALLKFDTTSFAEFNPDIKRLARVESSLCVRIVLLSWLILDLLAKTYHK